MNRAQEIANELIEKIDKLKAENAKLKVLLGNIEARMQGVFSDIANYREALKE